MMNGNDSALKSNATIRILLSPSLYSSPYSWAATDLCPSDKIQMTSQIVESCLLTK